MRRPIIGAAGALVGTAVAVPLILAGQLRRARRVQANMQMSQDSMMREWRLPPVEPGSPADDPYSREPYGFYD